MPGIVRKLMDLPYQIITYFVVLLGLALPFFLFMKLCNRAIIRGKEHVQHAEPPFLFVSNHVSMLDDAFIGPLLFLPRAIWNFHFIPYHLPEKKNFFKGPFFSWLMYTSKCVPITRGKGVFQPGMEKLIRLLKRKAIVHLYPEGTRTRTGEIGKGKIGVGRLVRETGVKVIPCYHQGLDKVLPIGHKIPRCGKTVFIEVGEALRFDEYMQLPNTPKTWQMISDQIIEAIRNLQSRMLNERKKSDKFSDAA